MSENMVSLGKTFCVSRRSLLGLFLLVVVLFSSLFVSMFVVNSSSGASLAGAVHVKTEEELKNAINNTSSKEITIALDNDIALTESSLTIPYNKNISLTSNRPSGFYKLTGIVNQATIVVDGGVLKLDGIIVSGGGYSGIHVHDNGLLVMYYGEISDNIAYISGFNPFGYIGTGGGVRIDSGVFEMYGGKISNNHAQGYGGGVSIELGGAVFSMFGGTISGNTAKNGGGGVFCNYGNFSMFGGTISGNTAEYGGGVYSIGGGFSRFGGVISGNTATIEDDNVYPDYSGGGSSSGNSGPSSSDNGSSGGNNGGSSIGDGFSLRAVVFVCVWVLGVWWWVLWVWFCFLCPKKT